MRIRILLPILIFASACIGCNTPAHKDSTPVPSQREMMFQKLFPMTYALETSAQDVITKDSTLCIIGQNKYEAIKQEGNSLTAGLAKFTEDELVSISGRLGELTPKLQGIANELRLSGKYCNFNELPDNEFLAAVWNADAKAMNRIIDIYALGVKPRYASIDSIDFKPGKGEIKYVSDDIRHNVLCFSKDRPFYSVTLETALNWLDANGRSEAVDFEPMEDGINKAAYAAIKTTDWNKYQYSIILVLGCGPEKVGEAISAQSRMRAAYGAKLYMDGKAPFIVVSGGRVHPFKTPYSEAEEMRKYLIKTWGVPESAVIAEPHARHTTTNIRNTVRIMMEQGIPLDRPGLITSGASHIDYVCGDYFRGVCEREMHLLPFETVTRLNPREAEFKPSPKSTLLATEEDPLDP